jgi:hypothetical protein
MQRLARGRIAIAIVIVVTLVGIILHHAMGNEMCDSCRECRLAGRIQAACRQMREREPYQPFDDHFPRFHPVPVSPVFPSLYEPPATSRTAIQPGESKQRKMGPVPIPHQIPVPLPEVVPTPPAKSGANPVPNRVLVPRQALQRPATGGSWIFLPASRPVPQGESPLDRGSEVASQGGRLAR